MRSWSCSSLSLSMLLVLACGSDPEPALPDGAVAPGVLEMGAPCTDSAECVSELCLEVGAGRAVCTLSCTDRAACPSGESWDCVQPSGADAPLCACTANSPTEICGDGRDNNCDGVTDCGALEPGAPDSTVPDDAGMQQADAGDAGEQPGPTCETDPGLCSLCQDDTDCEDGVFCTSDVCRGGGCVHVTRDNGCESTEICDPRSADGCVTAKTCASDADCADDDGCTRSEYCDMTVAICRYQLLDGDRDGHWPTACGGDDCDDTDGAAYPGARDLCDGRDNDCDGMIDPPSAALACADGRMCQAGACVCEPSLTLCEERCVDPASYQTDPRNCGGCGNDCGFGMACEASACVDIDECVDDPCGEHSSCVNYTGGYNCPCDDGYIPDNASGECVDANECTRGEDDCDATPNACVNTVGSFECECPEGYEGDGVGSSGCDDVDECDDEDSCPGAHATCLNETGSYSCGCEDGWQPNGSGVCVDLDECASTAFHNCDTSPIACVDLEGSFECSGCPATHAGDGEGTLGCTSRVVGLTGGGGGDHNCARLAEGRVQCWGASYSGQVGIGSTSSQGTAAAHLVAATGIVSLGTDRTATAVFTGTEHSCAILDNGAVKCWGENSAGQLGIGTFNNRGDGSFSGALGDALPAVALGTDRTAQALALGTAHSCALLDNATVKCWGDNAYGQLGVDGIADRGGTGDAMGDTLPAVALGAGRTAKAIAAGEVHTCAVLDDDTVKCWGSNGSGRLGQGSTASLGDGAGEMAMLQAISLGTGLTASAIAAGNQHTCALLNNGAVKCWGENASGQLGLDSTTDRGDAAGEMGDALPAVALGEGRTAIAIGAGTSFTCALLDDRSVKCWGLGTSGRLGRGSTTSVGTSAGSMLSLTPVALGAGLQAQALRVGNAHVCVLFDNERVKCWGENAYGQLGVGDSSARGDAAGEMGDALGFVRLGG